MKFSLDNKTKTAIKIIFSAALCVFIFLKLKSELTSLSYSDFEAVFSNPIAIFILIALTILNWYFDTVAYLKISTQNQTLRFLPVLKTNLISQYIGLLTPLGIGEYRSKMRLFTDRKARNQSIVSTLSYRWSKAAVKFGFGILAFTYYTFNYTASHIVIIELFIGILWIIGLFNFNKILNLIIKVFKLDNKFDLETGSINLKPTLIPSLIKFLSYTLQFAFILYLSGTPFSEAFYHGILIYAMASLIPQLSFLDPFIKGFIGIYLNQGTADPNTILTATFIVWVLNIGIPAIGGAYLWFRPNLRQEQ